MFYFNQTIEKKMNSSNTIQYFVGKNKTEQFYNYIDYMD